MWSVVFLKGGMPMSNVNFEEDLAKISTNSPLRMSGAQNIISALFHHTISLGLPAGPEERWREKKNKAAIAWNSCSNVVSASQKAGSF